jgi:hypothetical protein
MTTHDRVRAHTPSELNQRIRERTNRRIAELRDDPDRIAERLEALDGEWDIERALELVSSSLSLAGLALARRSRRWLLLPAVVQAFFLQHASQGWCPPLPILRRLGFRTQQEIERERYTLRALLREHIDVGMSVRPAEAPARRD